MTKSKQLLWVTNNKVIIVLFVGLFFNLKTKTSCQTIDDSQNCPIKSYLEKSDKKFTPTFSGAKVDKMQKDQILIGTKNEKIYANMRFTYLLTTEYKLKDGLSLKIGKGKLDQDSIYYFSIPGQISEFYKVKKQCQIKFYGYNITHFIYKHKNKFTTQLYFTLKSSNCNILFSLIINKPNIIFGQYDYL